MPANQWGPSPFAWMPSAASQGITSTSPAIGTSVGALPLGANVGMPPGTMGSGGISGLAPAAYAGMPGAGYGGTGMTALPPGSNVQQAAGMMGQALGAIPGMGGAGISGLAPGTYAGMPGAAYGGISPLPPGAAPLNQSQAAGIMQNAQPTAQGGLTPQALSAIQSQFNPVALQNIMGLMQQRGLVG